MSKHTPGPWHSEDTNSARLSKVVVADELGSNGSTVIIGQMSGPDVEGNCRLVVAAPDMLAALKSAAGLLEHMAAWIGAQNAGYSFEALGEDMPEIRSAIAKADGRP